MAKTEGDAPNPEDLKLSEIDFAGAELAAEPAGEVIAEPAAEPAVEAAPESAAEPVAEATAEPVAEPAAGAAPEPSPTAEANFLSETAEEEKAETEQEEPKEEEEAKTPKLAVFLEKLKEANPYTVMLGVALLCLVIAVFYLLLEWSTYGLFRIKPNINKPGAFQPAQSAPASTTAMAWPMGVQLSSIAAADEARSGSPRMI